jgi:hypothetical protein
MTTVRFLTTAALAIIITNAACASRSHHYSLPSKGGAQRGFDARIPDERDASAHDDAETR